MELRAPADWPCHANDASLKPSPLRATCDSPERPTKCPNHGAAQKKGCYFCDQSHYIHENKQNMDKMPRQYMDIFGKIQPNL
jgi:hypothetical protein